MNLHVAILLVVMVFYADASAQVSSVERVYTVPDINGRATLLVRPVLSGEAMIGNDGATVTLKVVVNQEGEVVTAKCSTTCPAAVAAAAEAAAMASKFRPLLVDGRLVKYEGSLIYTIAVQRVNWFNFGAALYSTYIFDNISLGPVAEMLTAEFGEERSKLHELDNRVPLETRWKTITAVRESIKRKLKASDSWWFDLGIAVRKVTAPFQSDKKFDRDEVQKALSDLSRFAESPPEGISKNVIEEIRAAANYKIDPSLAVQELRGEIFKLAAKIRPVLN